MANTGILYRRNTKANLIANPPIIGEIVYAIDTEEYGAIVNNQLVWRPHVLSWGDIPSKPTITYTLAGDSTGVVAAALDSGSVYINTTVVKASGSFSVGLTTPTPKAHSFVTGMWNEQKATAVVEVGIGTDTNNRLNAFEIHDDGRVLAPALTNNKIYEPHSLVTKQFLDDLVIDCGTFII